MINSITKTKSNIMLLFNYFDNHVYVKQNTKNMQQLREHKYKLHDGRHMRRNINFPSNFRFFLTTRNNISNVFET